MSKKIIIILQNNWPLILSYLILLSLSMGLQPIGDDWFFLKYFPQISQWHCVNEYHWLNDNILLPRDYWRPIEDVMYSLQMHIPWSFPYLNHFMAVTCAFVAIEGICYLGYHHLGLPQKLIVAVCGVLVWMPNNMGAMLSIDSITMTSATMFTVLSIIAYNQYNWKPIKRYVFWIMLGLLACFSKENGVVCFVLGPVFKLICEFSDKHCSFSELFSKRVWKLILLGVLPSVVYLAGYASLQSVNHPHPEVSIEAPVEGTLSSNEVFTSSQTSHQLTPATFVKNIFIEFFAGFYPVDTCAIYYRSLGILIFSAIISLSGIYLLLYILKRTPLSWYSPQKWGILLMALIASMPSLVTRAGEISPFISNVFLFLWVAVMVKGLQFHKRALGALGLFICAAVFTDTHKYVIAFNNGMETRALARAIASQCPHPASKILLIDWDEESLDPGGGAFNKSVFKGFHGGSAVIREFGYKGPSELQIITLPIDDRDVGTEELIEQNKSLYDYIWIVRGDTFQVISTHP